MIPERDLGFIEGGLPNKNRIFPQVTYLVGEVRKVNDDKILIRGARLDWVEHAFRFLQQDSLGQVDVNMTPEHFDEHMGVGCDLVVEVESGPSEGEEMLGVGMNWLDNFDGAQATVALIKGDAAGSMITEICISFAPRKGANEEALQESLSDAALEFEEEEELEIPLSQSFPVRIPIAAIGG